MGIHEQQQEGCVDGVTTPCMQVGWGDPLHADDQVMPCNMQMIK
jgi:hypothetical protein